MKRSFLLNFFLVLMPFTGLFCMNSNDGMGKNSASSDTTITTTTSSNERGLSSVFAQANTEKLMSFIQNILSQESDNEKIFELLAKTFDKLTNDEKMRLADIFNKISAPMPQPVVVQQPVAPIVVAVPLPSFKTRLKQAIYQLTVTPFNNYVAKPVNDYMITPVYNAGQYVMNHPLSTLWIIASTASAMMLSMQECPKQEPCTPCHSACVEENRCRITVTKNCDY